MMIPVTGGALAWLNSRRSEFASERTTAPRLLDAISEIICQRDAEGIVQWASPSAKTVLGIAPDALVGSSLDMHLHPDDRVAVLANWQRAAATGSAPVLEVRWPHPQGKQLWLEMSSSALGSRGQFVTTLRDITRRRLAESELRRVRDDLTGAIAASPGVLYRLAQAPDGHWQLSFISSNVERMTGFSVASVTAAWPHSLVVADDICLRWRAFEVALDHGIAAVEYRMTAKDRGQLRVTDHIRRRDRADGTTELVGYLQDVTELRAAEQDLARARQEVDALTSTGPGLLYRARHGGDGQREILFVADGAERVVGVDAGTLTRPGWFAAQCDPAGLAAAADALNYLPVGGTTTMEFRLRIPNGGWRWLRDTVRAVAFHGTDFELIGYWTDITRERELARQLAEAAKLALLGEMATGMAHELKQPLASLGLSSELAALALQREPADIETARDKIQRIAEQTHRTVQLIEHMRIFGRRQDGPPGSIDFAAAVEGAVAIMSGRLRSRRVALIRDLPPNLPLVHGQLVLVEQVLINLFANACDAYAARAPRDPLTPREIHVSADVQDGILIARVADHAGGIPDEILARVFEPFFTTKPAEQGTGLGLSISYGIARDLGGTLTAQNTADGAVFELRLPIEQHEG